MNTQQRRFYLPFTTTTTTTTTTSKRPEPPQHQRGIPQSFFDGIRNIRTLKTASGMCGSCK